MVAEKVFFMILTTYSLRKLNNNNIMYIRIVSSNCGSQEHLPKFTTDVIIIIDIGTPYVGHVRANSEV